MAWNRSSGAPKVAPKKKPSAMRGIVAGLVVVCALGGLCLWMFSGEENAPKSKPEKEHGRIKEVKPAAPKVAKVEEEKVESMAAPKEKYPGEKILSCTTNSSGYVIELTVNKDGRRTKHVTSPKSIWSNSTDEMIAFAMTQKEDREMPPFPVMTLKADDEFMESLKTPIVILDTDSDEVKAKKQLVKTVREDVKARIEAGEHFCDIITDHQKIFNENLHIRADARAEAIRIAQGGDREGADVFVLAINNQLQKMGISPISIDDPADGGENTQTEGDK